MNLPKKLMLSMVVLVGVAAVQIGGRTPLLKQELPRSEAQAADAEEVKIAADFTLRDLDGRAMQLAAAVSKNKVTILNFFATWCPPCKAEIPDFQAFYKEFSPKGVGLIGVDIQEASALVRKFVKKQKMTYPVLLDTKGAVSEKYGVYSIPSTFVIDPKGRIVGQFVGLTTLDQLKGAVAKFLK